MSTKQQLTQADARALVATGNGNDDGNGTASAVGDGIRRSPVDDDNNNNSNTKFDDDDDNCDEEEMISLGLSVDGNSNDDGSSSVAVSLVVGNNNNTNNNNNSCTSAMPATPAATSTVMYNQQSYHHQGDREKYAGYGGHNNPTMVRSVAHQARHRRTPGAGNGHNHNEVSRRYYYLIIWFPMSPSLGRDDCIPDRCFVFGRYLNIISFHSLFHSSLFTLFWYVYDVFLFATSSRTMS